MSILETLAQYRVVPVVTGGLTADNAHAVADALVAGGLPMIEVTLRQPEAIGAVGKLVQRGDLLVFTGTVLTIDQAKASLDAGVRCLVAPGLDLKLVEWAQKHDMLLIPGATSATEITHAYNAGLRMLKFFPSEAAGGVPAMNALAGPFTGVKFMPTGGITFDMLRSYLTARPILAVGQGTMVRPDMLKEARWKDIEAETKRTSDFVRSLATKSI